MRHILGLAALCLLPMQSALADDLKHGAKLARQCSVCHGRNGISRDPEVPNIAGQSALYLEKSLTAYQTGERTDRRMTLIVKRLSKDDIRDLAAWFEAHEVTVEVPEL